jgi:hypothetical protein
MATIVHLPAELLEAVYHYLDSIDDVHHFGRTCKAAYSVIQRLPVYTGIMRSIIGKSPQHRFDIPLSRMLDLHGHIVRHFADSRKQTSTAQPHAGYLSHPFDTELVSAVTSDCPHGPCTACLPDTRVHEILARYQGLRTLEDEWLARQLTTSDLLPADFDTNEPKFRSMYEHMLQAEQDFRYGGQTTCSSLETTSYTSFNVDQRNRFYAAVTSVWLLNEIRWVSTHFYYPDPNFILQIRLLNTCTQWIQKQTNIPVLDALDRHAVFQFLYHHLLPIYGQFLADRYSSKLPLTFPSQLDKDKPHQTRLLQVFLLAGETYLQPPDLIDLVIRFRTSRRRPYPQLPIPLSTEKYQRPKRTPDFPRRPSSTAAGSSLVRYNSDLLRVMTTHLNMISRASIHYTEARRHPRMVVQPDENSLFKLVDELAKYLEAQALVEFKDCPGQRSLVTIWNREWGETWWRVWWWANSEDKVRAKVERWKMEKKE